MKKNIIKNKTIHLKYKIKKKFQAGIILKGWEIKSIKKKNININNSYIEINKNKEAYLIGAKISLINKNITNKNNHKERKIKILLKKKEIIYLYNKKNIKGYTIIPISIIIKNPWYKIIIGLSKGKKKYDKRKYLINKEWIKEKKSK